MMRRSHRLRRVCAYISSAFACLLVALVAGCHATPDEQQVREAITVAATAARGNDADGVLAAISDDFIGNDGEMDRHRLKQMLALRAFRHDSTGVVIGTVSIERQGDRLIATFTMTLTGGKPDSLLPERADLFEMTTAWRREGRRWRCYSAEWRQRL